MTGRENTARLRKENGDLFRDLKQAKKDIDKSNFQKILTTEDDHGYRPDCETAKSI